MSKNENQLANALITYFIAVYQRVHGRPPLLNRYKEKWGFLDMLADLGYDQSKDVVEYYMSLKKIDHPTLDLFRSYERFAKAIVEQAEDAKRRAELREETKARVEKWRASHGNDGTGST